MKNESVKNKVYANAGNPEVLRHIPDHSSLEILDVGCGAGDNAQALKRMGHVVDGVTYSEAEAEQARGACREVCVFNLEDGLPVRLQSKKYDTVICSHVLEHICFPEPLLTGIRDCLKPSGQLIVALPNLLHIKNRWNLLRGRVKYTPSGLMDNTHFRWYTFKSAKTLLRSHAFLVDRAYVTGYLPLGALRRILPKIAVGLDQRLCKTWPGLFGYQMVFVAQPKD